MMTREELEAKSVEALGELWSDAYKDLNGFRPRHQPTKEELVEFWLTFDENFERQRAEEAEIEARMRARLNERIDEMKAIMPFASTGDIMRYIADSEEVVYDNFIDWEHLDFKLGVKFGTCEQLAV